MTKHTWALRGRTVAANRQIGATRVSMRLWLDLFGDTVVIYSYRNVVRRIQLSLFPDQ
jgi:hypothetical protein